MLHSTINKHYFWKAHTGMQGQEHGLYRGVIHGKLRYWKLETRGIKYLAVLWVNRLLYINSNIFLYAETPIRGLQLQVFVLISIPINSLSND